MASDALVVRRRSNPSHHQHPRDLIDFNDDHFVASQFSPCSTSTELTTSPTNCHPVEHDSTSFSNDGLTENFYEGVASGSKNGNVTETMDLNISRHAESPFIRGTRVNMSNKALTSHLFYGRSGGSSTRSAAAHSRSHSRSSFSSKNGDFTSVSEPELSHDHSFTLSSSHVADFHEISDHVQRLEHNLSKLEEQQTSSDDRYIRLKQENAVLHERLYNMDEQLQMTEERWRLRLADEERKCRDSLQRIQREKSLELDAALLRAEMAQKERQAALDSVLRIQQERDSFRSMLDELKQENCSTKQDFKNLEQRTKENNDKLKIKKDDVERRLLDALNTVQELRRDNDALKSRLSMAEKLLSSSSDDFAASESSLDVNSVVGSDADVVIKNRESFRHELRSLRERNAELHAQLLHASFEHGHRLLQTNDNTLTPSLAQELDDMSKDQILNALKDQEIVNQKLRNYVDGILLRILETYPALLEIKPS